MSPFPMIWLRGGRLGKGLGRCDTLRLGIFVHKMEQINSFDRVRAGEGGKITVCCI